MLQIDEFFFLNCGRFSAGDRVTFCPWRDSVCEYTSFSIGPQFHFSETSLTIYFFFQVKVRKQVFFWKLHSYYPQNPGLGVENENKLKVKLHLPKC